MNLNVFRLLHDISRARESGKANTPLTVEGKIFLKLFKRVTRVSGKRYFFGDTIKENTVRYPRSYLRGA